MSSSKIHLKHDRSQQNTIVLRHQQQNSKNINKIATLQPYLAQIDKKHRNNPKKSLLSNNKNSKHNQSSSRSFRIKQLSTSSLYKLTSTNNNNLHQNNQLNHTRSKSKQPSSYTTIIQNHKLKIKLTQNRQRKIKSYEKSFHSDLSKTILIKNDKKKNININDNQQKNKEIQQNHHIDVNKDTINVQNKQDKINFFNDHMLRMNKSNNNKKSQNNSQYQKQRPPHSKFRKDKYQSLIPRKKSTFKSSDQTNLAKLSYTDVNIITHKNLQTQNKKQQLQLSKKTQQVRKNNFRRGKYQALHSSVNQKPQPKILQQQNLQPLHSQRLYELNKKQTNLTINQQMDILAVNQMEKYYRQVRNKQIQKSLEKSTQKYFGTTESYRPIKSKNQIQLYVSSMQNPSISLNKVSQSTNDKSDNRTKTSFNLTTNKLTDFYAYNFDFQPQKPNKLKQKNIPQKIHEIQDPSQQQSSFNNLRQSDFERQRKNAQIQFFNKQTNPKINWSDDDNCQIDDI